MRVYLIGHDGNVGSALAAACEREGWTVTPIGAAEPLPDDPGAVVVDAGPPGATGWRPAQWSNYFGAVERAVRVLGEAERKGYAAAVFCSTPWVAWRGNAYSDSKALIEEIARTHNRHGATVAIVDRVGMQNDTPHIKGSRFEESVRQREGELGERVIASILHALADRAADISTRR
jgi:nucleoside-diphosphate-sugar epimerase